MGQAAVEGEQLAGAGFSGDGGDEVVGEIGAAGGVGG